MFKAIADFHTKMTETFGGELDFSVEADGQIHRFRVPGDRPSSKNGWYVLNCTGMHFHGSFGCWKTQLSRTWSSFNPRTLYEARELEQQIVAARQQREQQRFATARKAAEIAKTAWLQAHAASPNHPYLQRKQVLPHGLKQVRERLLVPLYRGNQLVSLQWIFPNGSKRFLPGGRLKGSFALVGPLTQQAPVFLCEGWATGATLHEETGYPVVCAMNAGNLLPAGRQLQAIWPDLQIIVAADDDRATEAAGKGNPGMQAAQRAALHLGCQVVSPEFPADAPLELSDFNDLAVWRALKCKM